MLMRGGTKRSAKGSIIHEYLEFSAEDHKRLGTKIIAARRESLVKAYTKDLAYIYPGNISTVVRVY